VMLKQTLDNLNPFIINFCSISSNNNISELQLHIRADHGLDQCTYNIPTASQIAAIWLESDDMSIEHTN